MSNRAPNLGVKDEQKEANLTRNVTPTTSSINSNSSDGSGEEEPSNSRRRSGRLTPSSNSNDSNENSKAASRSTRKRRSISDDSNNNNSASERAAKVQKNVKFSQESIASSEKLKKQNVVAKTKKTTFPAPRVGTRSTRGSSEMVLLPDVMPRKKAVSKKVDKKCKKNENVVVVKMLTGTLYLHRGDRRRAEFIRFK